MDRKKSYPLWLGVSLVLAIPLGLGQCQAPPKTMPGLRFEQKRRPNIVFIMADELGYYELSCMGHPHISTPRIDAMAREGMRFTQCLAGSSLCAPTRCTLLTGKHTGHSSVRSNGGGTPLRKGEETFGSALQRVGYATGGFGKWGCGGRGSTGIPEEHGFDTFFGYYDQVHAHSYYTPYLIHNSVEVPLEGNRGLSDGKTYSHYRIFEEAVQFIEKHADQPFLCYLPVTPPHGLFDIPDADPAWQKYKDEPWPEPARRYAAMVTMLDRQVGVILDLLERLKLSDDTLVVFCGDNGGNDYFKGPDHPRGFHAPNVNPKTRVAFRGTKGTLYEGGLRVPMIARWPRKIRPGRVSDLLCWFPDVFPTLAELAGAPVPDDLDGISLIPELLGADTAGRPQQRHPYLYWELGRQTAVRSGKWKAVRPRKNGPWELYDLRQDPSESRDLAAANKALVSRLAALATAAHEPVREGSYVDRARQEKDRRARGGRGGRKRPPVLPFPKEGLIDRSGWRVIEKSSEATATGRRAEHAIDGDSRTHWHTRFRPDVAAHPHRLLIDMGATREVEGIVYLARQDGAWNGSLAEVEFFVGDSVDGLGSGKPALVHRFAKAKTPQRVRCAKIRGRYLLVQVKSEVNGGKWASIAEIGALGR